VRTIEQYANEYGRLGLLEFRREYGRPVLIGLGIVGELKDKSRGRSGTLKMQPISEALPAQSLVGRVWLVTKGPYGPRGPALTGGRDSSNDIVIPEFTISNQHFQFRYDITRLVLSDLGSTNGTFLNGERIEPGRRVPVANGARLVFGRYQFEFMTGPVFVKTVAQIAGEGNVDLDEPMVP
jgi:pSer/pThr/pTyr-binding forkhead associated (FHA) protein